jgi:serine O-acetyltransferase
MNLKSENSLSRELVEIQLKNLFPIEKDLRIEDGIFEAAYLRTINCVNSIRGWNDAGFNRFISWQYATYLYFLSREVFLKLEDTETSTRLFLLNKALNAFELYFMIELPDYFFLSHTPGLVFGQATYGNYCVFHQGCTVGRNGNNRPILEDGIVLYPNSSVIGRCLVRSNTVIAPGVQLVNQDTPGNCYVFTGERGQPVFKEIDEFYADRYFDREFKHIKNISESLSC